MLWMREIHDILNHVFDIWGDALVLRYTQIANGFSKTESNKIYRTNICGHFQIFLKQNPPCPRKIDSFEGNIKDFTLKN